MKKYNRYVSYFLSFIILGSIIICFLNIYPVDSLFLPGSNKENNRDNRTDSLKVIGLNNEAYNIRLTSPKTTVELGDSSLKISKRIKYIPGVAEAHRVIGIGYSYLGNFKLAIKNYVEALKYMKELKDIGSEAKIYNNIGNLYREIDDEKKALQYFRKSLAISRKIGDEELTAGLYFNIATVYQRKIDHEKSLSYFDKSYDLFKNRKDTIYMIMYLQNTGAIYYKLQNYKEAESRLTVAIKQAKRYNLYKILTGCYSTLSSIYIEQKRYPEAQIILDEGVKYAEMLNDLNVKYALVYRKYQLELANKNYAQALNHLESVYRHDSLLLSRNQSDNIGIASQHYIQLQKIRDKELIIAEQKYREATFRWIITLGISIFLFISILVLVLYYLKAKIRRRKELLIQSNIAVLEQKALQAMMNPHFVFNVMNSIQHFINQADSKTANQILSGFARLTRKHLEICMNSTISLHEELVYLQLYLSLEKIRFSDKMDFEIIVEENLDIEEIVIPSMIIQPFIENAIWHGIMPKEEGGYVKLDFRLEETELLISIVDNGVGISNSEIIRKTGHTSRGMTLIRERIGLLNKLNKRFIIIDQHQTGDYGTRVLIRIPV